MPILPMQTSRGFVSEFRLVCLSYLIPFQENILVTNDTPPTACLADFGFTTIALDPHHQMSLSQTLQGGTPSFMAPELLAPARYGLKYSAPTQQADVYAFSLVILQVTPFYRPDFFVFLTFSKVLTGELPFRNYPNYRLQELAHYVSFGARPEKPANAQDIGISDSLWELIQKCWDGQIAERPKIQEVVKGVGNAAAAWYTDMPPSCTDQSKDFVEDGGSDEANHGGFPLFSMSSHLYSNLLLVGITGSYHTREVLPVSPIVGASHPNETSTAGTQQTLVETLDGSFDLVYYRHLDQSQPSPATVPPKKRKGIRYHINKIMLMFERNSKH